MQTIIEIKKGGIICNNTDRIKESILKSDIFDNINTLLIDPIVSQQRNTTIATYAGNPKWKNNQETGKAKKRIVDTEIENHLIFPTA